MRSERPWKCFAIDEATGIVDVLTQLDVVGNMALVRTDHFSYFALSPSDQESAACVAFHPTASVTSTGSGWQQGLYCDNSGGPHCDEFYGNNDPKTNQCHDCPPCTAGLNCQGTDRTNKASLFVNCVP